jgi:hypothetical protein
LHPSEEETWETTKKNIKRRLGRGFSIVPPAEVTLKTIDQKRFIKNMRDAGIHPDPDEIRDVAYSIRDGLTNLLTNARSPLNVVLGDFGRFGQDNSVLAYEIEGWRGERANYGPNDDEGYMETNAVLLAERQLALGALAYAYGEAGLNTDDLAPSPHVSVARGKDTIQDYRMREIRGELGALAIDEAYFGDPIIEVKMYREMPPERIPVRQAWESLAPLPELMASTAVSATESLYDQYDIYETASYA